jgi:hypothetical protein
LVKSPEIKILKKITISGSNNKRIDAISILKVGPLEDVEKHREPVTGSSFADVTV